MTRDIAIPLKMDERWEMTLSVRNVTRRKL